MPAPFPHTFDFRALAARLLDPVTTARDAVAQRVLEHAAGRRTITTDPGLADEQGSTLGERAADRVARFGGSWTFIALFGGVLLAWVVVNSVLLRTHAFDPYPYIFLNLLLSMLAAIQAPIIMMSQNRLADKDRRMARHDYAVNLKSEIEIMALHEKFDALRLQELGEMLIQQQLLLEEMKRLAQRHTGDAQS
ncbi:MAG: DUF1003 domain-containing protein [Lysobacter sp.]|nr:MAG: DUF1003 domain-containing protein [Lysobacter sp.]